MSSKFSFAVACCLALMPPAYAQKGNVARGANLFQAKCQMCHPGGDNVIEPAHPVKGAAFLKRYPDDESIARRIREGSSNGRMPAFQKSEMTDPELVDIITYIRSLTPAQKKAVKAVSKSSTGKSTPCVPVKKK